MYINAWCSCRNSRFKPVFAKLKEDLARVNMYVREANDLALELLTDARYSVTLQIPSSNLSPNRRVRVICTHSILCVYSTASSVIFVLLYRAYTKCNI